MTDLTDIAPAAEKVAVGNSGKHIECVGISGRSLVVLLNRFPSLKEAIFSRMQDVELNTATAAKTLMDEAPDAIAAIIAAGTGNAGDAKQEAAADAFPIELQFDLMTGILKATMPSGVGPFLVKLMNWFGGISDSFPKRPPIGSVADAPAPLNGKDRDTSLQPRSSA